MSPAIRNAALNVNRAIVDAAWRPLSPVGRDIGIQFGAWELLNKARLTPEEAGCLFIELDASFNRLAQQGYFPTGDSYAHDR